MKSSEETIEIYWVCRWCNHGGWFTTNANNPVKDVLIKANEHHDNARPIKCDNTTIWIGSKF